MKRPVQTPLRQAGIALASVGAWLAAPCAQAQESLPFPPRPSASTAGLTMQESVYTKRATPARVPGDAPPSAAPASPTAALAGQQPAPEAPTGALDAPTDPGDPVRLSLSPYAWLTSLSGDATVRGVEVDATASFLDIIERSDTVFGLMGAADLEYERLVFQLNSAWTTAEFSESAGRGRNRTLDAEVDLDTVWVEAFGGYRFLDRRIERGAESHRRFTLDGFVGGRVTAIDIDANLTATADITLPDGEMLSVGQSTDRGQSEEWFEPFVGARLGLDITDHWSLSLRGDVGGFGVSGADFAWQTAVLLGYRWRLDGWNIAVFGGYRALGQDYSDGEFGWDVVTHGPLLGAQFSWSF